MTNSPFWNEVFIGLLVSGLAGLVAVFWSGLHSINEKLSEINVQLATMNGRLGKTELWQVQHEKSDDDRHEEMRQGQRDLWQAVTEKK